MQFKIAHLQQLDQVASVLHTVDFWLIVCGNTHVLTMATKWVYPYLCTMWWVQDMHWWKWWKELQYVLLLFSLVHNSNCVQAPCSFTWALKFESPIAASCGTGAFWCTNGQCIRSSDRCDGTRDCTDGSDETGCSMLCLIPEIVCKCIVGKIATACHVLKKSM